MKLASIHATLAIKPMKIKGRVLLNTQMLSTHKDHHTSESPTGRSPRKMKENHGLTYSNSGEIENLFEKRLRKLRFHHFTFLKKNYALS